MVAQPGGGRVLCSSSVVRESVSVGGASVFSRRQCDGYLLPCVWPVCGRKRLLVRDAGVGGEASAFLGHSGLGGPEDNRVVSARSSAEPDKARMSLPGGLASKRHSDEQTRSAVQRGSGTRRNLGRGALQSLGPERRPGSPGRVRQARPHGLSLSGGHAFALRCRLRRCVSDGQGELGLAPS